MSSPATVDVYRRGRKTQVQVVQMNAFGGSCSLQRKFLQLKSALLIETHTADLCVERIGLQSLQGDGCRKFVDADVMRIEPAGCIGFRQHIVVDLSATDKYGIDTQVDGLFALCRIF